MSLSHCPRCHEQVTLPVGANPQARVRCPLCQEEYLLQDALQKLPPTLILLDDLSAATGGNQDASSWRNFEQAAIDIDDAEEFSFQPLESESPAAASAFAVSDARPTPASSDAAIRTSRRPKKAKGSPIKSIIGMVLGGVLAFPIAQMILWHLPGEWKRDLGFGPKVAQLGPWISWAVPAKFRGNSSGQQSSESVELPDFTAAPTTNNEGTASPSTQNESSPIPDFQFGQTDSSTAAKDTTGNQPNKGKKGKGKKQSPGSNSGDLDSNDADSKAEMPAEDAVAEAPTNSPLEVPTLTIEPLTPTLELPGVDATTEPKSATSTSTPLETPEPSLTIDPPSEVTSATVGVVRDASVVSSEQLANNFTAAQDANTALDAADPNDTAAISPVRKSFYLALANLGQSLAYANQADETAGEQLAGTMELLSAISQQGEKLKLIDTVGAVWLDIKRPTEGVMLHGTIQSVTPHGELFLTKVQLASSDDRTVTLVSHSDPTEQFEPNRRILVLGSIVTDPAKNLGGFTGDETQVVLDGFHYVLPTE